jgi:hypothetical protein
MVRRTAFVALVVLACAGCAGGGSDPRAASRLFGRMRAAGVHLEVAYPSVRLDETSGAPSFDDLWWSHGGSTILGFLDLDAHGHTVDWEATHSYTALVRRPRTLEDDARGAAVVLEPTEIAPAPFAVRVFGDDTSLAREERLVAHSLAYVADATPDEFLARDAEGCSVRYYPRARAALLRCANAPDFAGDPRLLARAQAVLARS